MGLAIAFWILAIVAIVAALGVIVQKNVFRAALSLIVCLVAVAGIFITLSADFLAGVQILVYVGAISVVIILAIMLTGSYRGSHFNRLSSGLSYSAAFWTDSFRNSPLRLQVSRKCADPTTPGLAEQLFGQNGFLYLWRFAVLFWR